MNSQSNRVEGQRRAGKIDRRACLATAAATAAAGLIASPQTDAEAADAPQGYIDAHVHVWTPDTQAYPLDAKFDIAAMQPPSFTPAELLKHTAAVNVDRVVLIQMSFYGYDNSYMLDVIAKQPDRFRGVAVIDSEDRPAETMKSLRPKGVRGFRIVAGQQDPASWLSGEGMQAMWRCAADESMAICPLMNPEYLPSVDRMCRRYPDTRVVVDHFARIGIDGTVRKRDLDALCRLSEHDNVYVKTSAFYALGKKQAPYTDLGDMIQRVLGAFGGERLMWASDCPYQVQPPHTYHASIDLIRKRLDFLSPRDREWILRDTAERVFFNA